MTAPICLWCLQSLETADHTACQRVAGGGK